MGTASALIIIFQEEWQNGNGGRNCQQGLQLSLGQLLPGQMSTWHLQRSENCTLYKNLDKIRTVIAKICSTIVPKTNVTWKVQFNPKKSIDMIFSNKRLNNSPLLIFKNTYMGDST